MTETYMQKLYRTSPEFREKQKKQARAWHNDHKEYVRKREKIRYANRTKLQIEERKIYLKKLKSTQSYKDRENKRQRKVDANRTVQQIEERKQYLKKIREKQRKRKLQ